MPHHISLKKKLVLFYRRGNWGLKPLSELAREPDVLTGSDSRAPNLINTEHLNTKHAPSDTDFGLGLLLSQTTHSPVAFKMFNHMGSFLQVKPCTEAPNLYSIDKIKV